MLFSELVVIVSHMIQYEFVLIFSDGCNFCTPFDIRFGQYCTIHADPLLLKPFWEEVKRAANNLGICTLPRYDELTTSMVLRIIPSWR